MSAAVCATKQYIEQREGCYRFLGKRVSLDSVIYAFLAGASPESIVQAFPVLTLEEVYGGIAFYLAHHEVIDAYLKEGEQAFEKCRIQSQETNPLFYQKLRESRES